MTGPAQAPASQPRRRASDAMRTVPLRNITWPLTPLALQRLDAWWRAANYLSVGQIYLLDNPLLREPLQMAHVKPLVVGHWGTVPGQNFIYTHLNRAIRQFDLDMLYISGPGHGGQAMVAQSYLDGSYTEIYPEITRDLAGMQRLFAQFSFPGGISSHVAPTTPGSIHEGGELGYSLSHAFGAAFDNPGLIVACVIGDGEAETAALATAWHSNKFLDPVNDGAVLPVLHLNGYKISSPTLLSRISADELDQYLVGCGWVPWYVEGSDPQEMHQLMAATLDRVIEDIQRLQRHARIRRDSTRPRWPMIVLRTPKGWTGPVEVDGLPVEGTFRSHQVPLLVSPAQPEHLPLLEAWLNSYQPQHLFDRNGRLFAELAEQAPAGTRRMAASRHANCGVRVPLTLPPIRAQAQPLAQPGTRTAQDTAVLGQWLAEVVRANAGNANFRVFGPDETLSNALGQVFTASARQWHARLEAGDEWLATDGRVMDAMLSEHQCQGWLEGYLLTGRHGLFNSYEGFIRIVDSMFTQHAKWLKVSAELPWRRPIASLNYLLTSHVWQQDHNGFSHQDPGFLDHVVNKKAGVVRIYLPPDANCLLAVFDHCLRSTHQVNVVVAGKHSMPQWLDFDAAVSHCAAGIGRWDWASSDADASPDIVLACCGDTPTLEVLGAVSILRAALPTLRVRVVNVVDLMRLQPRALHPHGLHDAEFNALFTTDVPVLFAFHGYPALVHQLTYRRANRHLHVRGYLEEGTITTPFDMRVQNRLDRFHLVQDVLRYLPWHGAAEFALDRRMEQRLAAHADYIRLHGEDLPEIREWHWSPQDQA